MSIDIRPGCATNWIVLDSPLEIPVVLFGSATFSVVMVDGASLSLAGAPPSSLTIAEMNGDGFLDLVSSYVMSSLLLAPQDTMAILTGALVTSLPFAGNDLVTIVSTAGAEVTVVDDGSGYSITLSNDHAVEAFSLSDCVSGVVDQCGNSLSVDTYGQIVKITSDEVSRSPRRALHVGADMEILSNSSFGLRRERNGNGDGRVYTVHFTVTDGAGNTTAASAKLQVPHNPSGPSAIDSGVAACVGNCP